MIKIYAIRNKTTDKVYIGSTKRKYLSVRLSQHRYYFRNSGNVTSSQVVCCPTAYIEELETCEEAQRFERERYWIENTIDCVNKVIPNRKKAESSKKWRERNLEKAKAKCMEYYYQHRDEINERKRKKSQT